MAEKCLFINDLKDMLNKTKELYAKKPAYKIKIAPGEYKIVTHEEFRNMVDYLGTALISLGLKDKRIAIIGENRFEWCLSYLAVACGTGVVVPLDKSLPENELSELVARSEVEAIFYSKKYSEALEKIRKNENNNLKYLISMDLEENKEDVLSQNVLVQKGKKLLENGDRSFVDAKINAEEMGVMLFTSGTTSKSKVVALSHKNICTNIMDLAKALELTSEERTLSFLPIHHVFECTVGFLQSLYVGCQVSFSDGIRHILENLNEYKITYACFVPGIYETLYKTIIKNLEKTGKLENIKALEEEYKNASMEEKREVFKEIHDIFGGEVKLFVTGAAAIDKNVAKAFRNWGINLCQGYGLTETSPVVAIETRNINKIGSIGKTLESVEVKLADVNEDGMGELIVKGPSVMLGYYQNEEANKEVLKDGWFYTGDLAKIDEEGYIFICGRKKNVIVLKNGKNVFPEETEVLINRIEGVKESFVFGKKQSEDYADIKIFAKIVIDKKVIKEIYNAETDEEIYKVLWNKIIEINRLMPKYKSVLGIIITEEPLIKTTTNKIKRQENMKLIENV